MGPHAMYKVQPLLMLLSIWIPSATPQGDIRWAHICTGSGTQAVRCPVGFTFKMTGLYNAFRSQGCPGNLTDPVSDVADCQGVHGGQEAVIQYADSRCHLSRVCELDLGGAVIFACDTSSEGRSNFFAVSYKCNVDTRRTTNNPNSLTSTRSLPTTTTTETQSSRNTNTRRTTNTNNPIKSVRVSNSPTSTRPLPTTTTTTTIATRTQSSLNTNDVTNATTVMNDPTTSTAPPTTTSTGPPTTSSTAPPTTSSTAPPTTSSTAPPTTPSTAPPTTSSTAPPTTSSTAPPTTSSTAPPTTSSTAPPTTPSTAPPTTSSTAPPTTSSTAPPTTSSTAPPTTSSTAPPTTSSTAPPTTTPKPDTRWAHICSGKHNVSCPVGFTFKMTGLYNAFRSQGCPGNLTDPVSDVADCYGVHGGQEAVIQDADSRCHLSRVCELNLFGAVPFACGTSAEGRSNFFAVSYLCYVDPRHGRPTTTEEPVTAAGDFPYLLPIVIAAGASVVLILTASIIICCLCGQKRDNKERHSGTKEVDSTDGSFVKRDTVSDVNITPRGQEFNSDDHRLDIIDGFDINADSQSLGFFTFPDGSTKPVPLIILTPNEFQHNHEPNLSPAQQNHENTVAQNNRSLSYDNKVYASGDVHDEEKPSVVHRVRFADEDEAIDTGAPDGGESAGLAM